MKLFVPQEYLNRSAQDYTNKEFITWNTSRISDEYMPRLFKTPNTREEIIKEKISGESINATNISEKTNYLSGNIEVSENTVVLVHIPYFPAWKYYVNGSKINAKEVESGVSFSLPKGISSLEARFEQTPIEKMANLLTLSGITLIVAGIIYGRKSRQPRPPVQRTSRFGEGPLARRGKLNETQR